MAIKILLTIVTSAIMATGGVAFVATHQPVEGVRPAILANSIRDAGVLGVYGLELRATCEDADACFLLAINCSAGGGSTGVAISKGGTQSVTLKCGGVEKDSCTATGTDRCQTETFTDNTVCSCAGSGSGSYYCVDPPHPGIGYPEDALQTARKVQAEAALSRALLEYVALGQENPLGDECVENAGVPSL